MTNRQAKIQALAILGNMQGTGIHDDKIMTAIDTLQIELRKKAKGMQASENKRIAKKATAE